ncbi:MAG: NADH-quinone oxidoreductase subunit M [Nitrospirota bacterium]
MTNVLNFPILSIICLFPLIAALIIAFFFKKENTKSIKNFAFGSSLIVLLISLFLLPFFDKTTYEMQFVERLPWIASIGVDYFLGIDGISLLLILMTVFLMPISIVSSYSAIQTREKEYYIFLLLLETGMIGVFIALDFFLFYIFWEVMLIPMYFIIGIWGGPRKLYATIKFFLYTLFGSVLMLLGIIMLYFLNKNPSIGSGEATFNILTFMEMNIPMNYQFWIFLAFFLGFAIKVPMFPFHTWLPDAHVEAPTAGSVILAGILLKMGTYGFVRLSLPILPEASRQFVPFIVTLAIIGIIYGALVAMAQKDIKKLVAYSSVSHLGYVMLGLFSLNINGISGGIMQMINHGISTGALFLIVGIMYERTHTRMIDRYGGLSPHIPIFMAIFTITVFSSMGFPGLNGFVGELMVIVGAYKANYIYAIFASMGIILGAAYMLWLLQRIMLGTEKRPEEGVMDCNKREICYMLPLIVVMFWIGLYPTPYLKIIEPSVQHIVQRLENTRSNQLAETGRQLSVKCLKCEVPEVN